MAVSLSKGGNVSLSRTEPSLKKILIGLGWEARSSDGEPFDLDASAFMVGENGKVWREEDFIFYNQLVSTCGSVEHTGDDPTGGSGGDDEALKIDFEKVPESIKRVIVCVTIHDAEARRQNFGQVDGAFMRIENLDNDLEIARFDLTEDYSTETAMIFGEVYRHNSEWKFKAVGQGFSGGLEALCEKFGVKVAN
ncbi:TerD family protein [Methylicorpusculum sp.]|uniref:TerD family protein n=1 Tax=Methylicorpusculum sp. TaxID=2713644 RepID=UPI00272FBBD7|nr:TerD family protein [Methylicorpusculum sp.]MDP2177243.1 TerD family protein [Methylicorpusculum sp.]MDP3531168.1 TerD family protein [Methylicorpusculum sp.]MDZ4154303.1 TerD family protein [Methylicorpusculum sp.]